MPASPSGTVTFLFTDVVGSTKRWERHREAMHVALRRHDEIVRGAIEREGGHVFKTVGDAFCAAFETVEAAALAACEAQRALAGENWDAVDGLLVRMALHAGSVEVRDDDYFGPVVNRVARLLALAHGGQVLLSGAAAGLLARALPPGLSLLALGRHALRDFAGAEEVSQLVFEGARTGFAPLSSALGIPNNLPRELTSFVGGDDAVDAIRRLLESARLVTLRGTGGVGKTRTAIRVGTASLESWPDGVWFVELAPITDPALVPVAVASALGLSDFGGRSLVETLLEHLCERSSLLVLDNCEHIIDAAAAFVDTLLQRCPRAHLLATSREPLRVAGEAVHEVRPLELPAYDPQHLPTVAELEAWPATRLFLDRARSVTPAFRLDVEHRAALLDIGNRLDGIPLAIELAAARVTLFSLPALAERLHDRFALLTRGSRSALPHHRTLRALVDWSFDLLSDDERRLFRRLAVFAGGWSLEDAEALLGRSGIDAFDVLPLLESLCEKSLVHVDLGGAPRFRFLQTIRTYAAAKLEMAGEKDDLERAHARYYAELAERAAPHLRTGAQIEWVASISRDVDNYRAALDATERTAELGELGLTMAGNLGRYWVLTGAYFEGRIRLERQCARAEGPPDALARALCAAAIIALNRRDLVELKSYARRALDVAERATDPWTQAWAAANYSGALSHAPEDAGDILEEHPAHVRARALAEASGDAGILAHVEAAAAFRADARGDERATCAHHEAALAHARRSGDRFIIAASAMYLGYRLQHVEPRRSALLLAESASLFEAENVLGLAACFEGAARLATERAALEAAARFLGTASTFRQSGGVPAWRLDPGEYRARVASALDTQLFEQLWNEGKNAALHDAIEQIRAFAATIER